MVLFSGKRRISETRNIFDKNNETCRNNIFVEKIENNFPFC
jgi:hypothetical protein